MKFNSVVVLAVCFVFLAVSYASPTFAQDRDRLVVKTTSSRPVNQPTTTSAPTVKTLVSSKPILTNEPVVQKPLIQKTADVQPAKSAPSAVTSLLSRPSSYDDGLSGRMLNAINSK